jgi:hypothetical protein
VCGVELCDEKVGKYGPISIFPLALPNKSLAVSSDPASAACKATNIHKAKYLPFDDSLEGSAGKWIQELREQGDRAVPVR